MLDKLDSNRTDRQKQIDRQISRVLISIKDMQGCLEFTSAWDASLSKSLRRALITATVISYARPFSKNNDHPKATETHSFSLNNLKQEERRLHVHLCNLRKKAIAHSDFTMSSCRPIEYLGSTRVVIAKRMYDPLAEASKMPDIHSLATTVHKLLKGKLSELVKKRNDSDD